MQYIALVAALIAALLTGALNFAIRSYLDAKTQKQAEQRLAYVYLVRVSGLVAAEAATRNIFKAIIPPEKLAPLPSYEVVHKLCVELAAELSKNTREQILANPMYRAIPRWADTLLEGLKDSRLTAEQLAKMPKQVVETTERFQSFLAHVSQCVVLWKAFIDDDERYWISPEGLHDQWAILERVCATAREVRALLVAYGAASGKEADSLLQRQVQLVVDTVLKKWKDKEKLVAAEAQAANVPA